MSEEESSGTWLIHRIKEAAEASGARLTRAELDFLKTPMWELKDSDRPKLLELNNRLVPLVRHAIEQDKKGGATVLKVRRGLRVPEEWARHYSMVFQLQLPWALSGIMQNAVLQNPLAGETRKWKSP